MKKEQEKPKEKGKRPASNYAKKRRYLDKTGKWGWQYSEPKPWKSK